MNMEYPDEQQNKEIKVEEIPLNEQQVVEGFATSDMGAKINEMLGGGFNTEEKCNNNPLFDTSDKLLDDIVPTINAEEKIRQMLDF